MVAYIKPFCKNPVNQHKLSPKRRRSVAAASHRPEQVLTADPYVATSSDCLGTRILQYPLIKEYTLIIHLTDPTIR